MEFQLPMMRKFIIQIQHLVTKIRSMNFKSFAQQTQQSQVKKLVQVTQYLEE